MYAKVEKAKENKSRLVADSVGQKKSGGGLGVGIVDKRSEPISRLLTTNASCQHPVQMARLLGRPKTPPPPAFLDNHHLDAHHIIPNTVVQHAVEDCLNVFNDSIDVASQPFDNQWNGIMLPRGVYRVTNGSNGRPGHNGNHPRYSQQVENICIAQAGRLQNILFNRQLRENIANLIRNDIMHTEEENLDGIY